MQHRRRLATRSSHHGVSSRVRPAIDGAAKINVKGKGGSLLVPNLSTLGQPLRIQVRNSSGFCWEAIYSAPATKSTIEQFKDKAD